MFFSLLCTAVMHNGAVGCMHLCHAADQIADQLRRSHSVLLINSSFCVDVILCFTSFPYVGYKRKDSPVGFIFPVPFLMLSKLA